MPFYLEAIGEIPELSRFKSVLVVPCRFCPAASTAVREDEPYFDLLRGAFKTPAYEQWLERMKSSLERKGIKTGVFKSIMPHNFVLCMWTERQRKKLLKCAGEYEAILVLGCEAAVEAILDTVKSTSCRVFSGMKTTGLMNIRPGFRFPCQISLELSRVTPTQFPERR